MNQGGHMSTFGGNMAGNYAMQNPGYGHYAGNQGGFGGAQKENSYSTRF